MKNSNHKIISIIEYAIVCVTSLVLSFFITAYSPLHILTNGDVWTDSAVFKYVAMMMRRGYMPYRDTFDHKGPLLYVINYLGTFVSSYSGTWVVECLFIAVTVGVSYFLAKKISNRFWAVCTVIPVSSLIIYFYFGGNSVQEYAMPFMLVALYIFINYEISGKIGKLRLAICGACLAVICMLQINMAALWVVFCIAILIECIIGKEYKRLGHFILWFLIGFIVALIPMILWLALNGALIPCIEDYLLFNFKYIKSSWRNRAVAFSYFAKAPIVIISLILSVYSLIRRHNRLDIIHFTYLLFSLCMVAQSGIGESADYYGLMLVPTVVYPFSSFMYMFGEQCSDENISYSRNKLVIAGICVLLCGIMTYPIIRRAENLRDKYNNPDEVRHSQDVLSICNAIDDVTDYDDRITVWGNNDIIYLFSDRLSASKYSFQWPIGDVNPEIKDEYFDELYANTPAAVVCGSENNLDEQMRSFLNECGYYAYVEYGNMTLWVK